MIENIAIEEIVVTYVKAIKVGKNAVRVETKTEEDFDEWPTLEGVMTEDEAFALIVKNGWNLVPSWQAAYRLGGWAPKTGLAA